MGLVVVQICDRCGLEHRCPFGRPEALHFVTVAGAVLMAGAALEGLPLPPVHRVSYRPDVEKWDVEFDTAATIPDGQ